MAYDNSRPPEDKKTTAPRVTFTRVNTPFDVWKEMVLTECPNKNIDPAVIRPLAFRHGWEDGDTPAHFVDIYVRRKAKDESRGR